MKLLSRSLEILHLPRELNRAGAHTRIVALSATPGADVPSVKQVLQNLFISKIELRHEESEDIVPYTHHRNVDKIVVPLDEDLVNVRNKLLSVQVLYLRGLSWIAPLSVRLNRKSMSRSWLPLMLWGKVTTLRATPSSLSSTQGTNGVRTLLEVFQTMFEDRWKPLELKVEFLWGLLKEHGHIMLSGLCITICWMEGWPFHSRNGPKASSLQTLALSAFGPISLSLESLLLWSLIKLERLIEYYRWRPTLPQSWNSTMAWSCSQLKACAVSTTFSRRRTQTTRDVTSASWMSLADFLPGETFWK